MEAHEAKYLEELLEKFNQNREDPSITEMEKVFLGLLEDCSKETAKLFEQMQEINSKIVEFQNQGEAIKQNILRKQGESNGYANSLVKMKKE